MDKKLTADLNVVANSNLEIEYLNGDLNIIQKLDDEPNDVGGLTSAQLKAKFDEAGNTIKAYINDTLIPAILADDATEAEREAAEQERVTAEQGRVSAEEARVTAETARDSAETARQSAETARSGAESTRQSMETTRQTAETERNSAETDRQAAETARASAESERRSAESNRATAEGGRASAEASRAAAEQGRVSAESTRVQDEQKRVSAENSRAEAEAQRAAAEQARTDENTGIVAQATAQANAAAGSAESASASARTAQSAANSAGTAASTASSAATAAFGSASNAAESAAAAAGSVASVAGINKTAESWAVGGTGTREGENTNNAKYWAQQAAATVGGDFATKTEAQGYVADHNQSATAHSDIRKILNNSVRYDAAQSLSTAQKKQARDNIGAAEDGGVINGLNIQGGIQSIGSAAQSVAINPAINGAGFAMEKGAVVKAYYDEYEMPYNQSQIGNIFDGKAGTYINFATGLGADYSWNQDVTYPVGAYVRSDPNQSWYKAAIENTGVNPYEDETGTWTLASVSGSSELIDLTDVKIELDITFPSAIRYENTLSLYWRANGLNAQYVKVEKYGANVGWFTVFEKADFKRQDVINNIWLNSDPSNPGAQNRMRITFKNITSGKWLALAQLAITGIYGGIDGTLLNRGGDTVFGNITPNSAGGASLGTASLPWANVRAQFLYGNGSEVTAKFTQAGTRSNIATGEKISVLFGKVSKWFADLKGLAFKDKVDKTDLVDTVQNSLLPAVSASDNGKFLRAADGAWVAEQSIIYSTEDLTAGESPLADGVLYIVYE